MKKTTLFLTVFMLVYTSMQAQNLIENGDMENSTSWVINKRGTDATLDFAIGQGVSNSQALLLSCSDVPEGNFFVVINTTDFPFTQNDTIKATFWAKGGLGLEITPFVQESDGNGFVNLDKIQVEPSFQKYELIVPVTSNTSDLYRFKIRGSGGAIGDIYIDDLVLELYVEEEVVDEAPLSLPTNDITLSTSIYPNPTSDYLNIKEKHNYEVFNTIGQRILSGKSEKIDVRNLNAGVYIISIDNKIQHRFVKE